MKFYDCATAPSPRRARLFIAEKGLDIETIEVDLRNRAQLEEPFRSINPRCTVPALETEEGAVLTDNAGIMRYLEDKYPEPKLMGRTPLEAGIIADWTARIEQEGFMAVAEVLRNTMPGMAGRAITGPDNYDQIPELAQRGHARAQAFYRVLDARLGDSAYIAGDAFSAADINALVIVDFADRVKLRPEDPLPNLERWYAEISARPSVAG